MGYLNGQPWFTSLMDKGDLLGECAKCHKIVKEWKVTILEIDSTLCHQAIDQDDCYGVYRGRCPHCNAINLLDFSKGFAGRGYKGNELFLVLPTDHEIRMNNWETDVPTIKCNCDKCEEKS